MDGIFLDAGALQSIHRDCSIELPNSSIHRKVINGSTIAKPCAIDSVTATAQELIDFCKMNQKAQQRIVKLSERVLVKFGCDVTEAEFANQRYVWEHTHTTTSTFCVPQPIRYFQDESLGPHLLIGYIVMEFVHGTVLSTYLESASDLDQENVVNGLLYALEHLASIPRPEGQGLGPVGGGPLRGYLWSDSGLNCTFNTVPEFEDFLNTIADYIPGPGDKLDFTSRDIVLCHTDLAPRNILLLDDGRFALLDWANAGFYPPIFEIYALRTRVDREPIFRRILSRLPQEAKSEKQILRMASVERIFLRQGDAINLLSFPNVHLH